jgi:hypothetical protein
MKRLLCGTVVLAMSLSALSCGDPTASLRGGPTRISANPSSLIVTAGQPDPVIVRVLDGQGNELSDSVAVTFPASLVDVKVDSTFLVGTDTTNPRATLPSKTRTKFLVTGLAADSGHVTFTSGSVSLNVPVRVIPDTVAAAIAPQSSLPGDTVTITAAANSKFDDTAHVSFGAAEAVVTERATDGSFVKLLPLPGSTGHGTIHGVKLLFAQSSGQNPISFSVSTKDTVFVSSTVPPIPGTSSTATAPTIPIPAPGSVKVLFDAGTFAGPPPPAPPPPPPPAPAPPPAQGAQYYKLILATDATLAIRIISAVFDTDIDGVICSDAACTLLGQDRTLATAAHTEGGTVTLVAGTYYLAVVNAAGATPPWVSITVRQ